MPNKSRKMQIMQIGDFARKAGVSVRAIRYYEELGMLRPESYSSGGFRLYGQDNLKHIHVINSLKELGLSLTEIRQIFLAKKASGGDKGTVDFLLGAFQDKMKLVEEKLGTLNRMKAELARVIAILDSCKSCDHQVLLDTILCGDCANLTPRESVPDTFEVILQ